MKEIVPGASAGLFIPFLSGMLAALFTGFAGLGIIKLSGSSAGPVNIMLMKHINKLKQITLNK